MHTLIQSVTGAAGFFVSFIRIVTKLMLNDQQENTLIFFLISIAMVGLCFGLHHTVRRTAFIKYYIMLCQERKITLEPTEDAGLVGPIFTSFLKYIYFAFQA